MTPTDDPHGPITAHMRRKAQNRHAKRAFRERQERYLKDVTELPLRAPRARSISESDKSEYNYTPMGTQDSEDLDGSLFESWSVLSPTPREDLDDLLFENMTSLNLTPREDLDGYVVGNLTSLNPTLREAQTNNPNESLSVATQMANVETKVKGSSRELLAVQGGDVKTAEELRLTAYDLEESDKLLEDACIAFIPTPHRAETVKARIRMAEARTKIAGARIRMAEARITMAEARVKKAEARIEEAEAEAQFKKARPLNN